MGAGGAGRPGRKPARVAVGAAELATLERWAGGNGAPQALAQRARVVLACTRGASNRDVAAELGVSAHLVGRWRARFARGGLSGLLVEAPAGAPVQLDVASAAATGDLPGWVSKSTAARAARAAVLRPDAVDGALPRDAVLVGLHVFVSDTLFAVAPSAGGAAGGAGAGGLLPALRALTRRDLATTTRRSSGVRMKRFLRELADRVPAGPLHLVVDRAPTGIVRRWLDRRPRIDVHVTGTQHAWWALAERWSASAPPGLGASLTAFLASPDHEARPFGWVVMEEGRTVTVATTSV